MIVLDTAKKVVAFLSGAVAASQPEFVVAYADATLSTFTEGVQMGALNSTTAVDVVTAPSSGQRSIKSLWIHNKDTAAVTVTVEIDQSATRRRICKIQLQIDETLEIGVAGIRVVASALSGTPSFYVTRASALNISGADTKVTFVTEVSDTHGYFDLVTNHRFTPLVAGKYFFHAGLTCNTLAAGEYIQCFIYKNTGTEQFASFMYSGSTNQQTSQVCALFTMNGTTDYAECHAGTSDVTTPQVTQAHFFGFRVSS